MLPDPRIKATLAEWQEQSRVALQIRDRFSEANDAVKEIRRVKAELADRAGEDAGGAAGRVRRAVGRRSARRSVEVEDSLYQTKNRSGQDPLNYPIRLNNRIGALMGVVASSDGTADAADVRRLQSCLSRAREKPDEASQGDERQPAEDQRHAARGWAEADRLGGADLVSGVLPDPKQRLDAEIDRKLRRQAEFMCSLLCVLSVLCVSASSLLLVRRLHGVGTPIPIA